MTGQGVVTLDELFRHSGNPNRNAVTTSVTSLERTVHMAVHCRKNQATLSQAERDRFVATVLALKASGGYDDFVQQHMGAMASAHRGPAFLPWHREYLRRFEVALQAIDGSVTLPYWDWTVDNSPSASLWDPSFLGGNGRPSDGVVETGPFAYSTGNWTLAFDGPALRRRFGLSAPSLPSLTQLASAMSETVYDVPPWNRLSASGFRNRLEGWINAPPSQLHNLVHVWVGGSMGPMSSPNDPVFFLHHCFVDKIWADWQAAHPGVGFEPVSGAPAGHNLPDAMQPWLSQGESVTIASVLDHHALGYAYDTEGLCRPTLKFIDDPIHTLKFRDDIPTLKFSDDPVETFKFRDDIPTLKFRDDIDTLKFADDVPTVKFRDDVQTLKFVDDGGGGMTANKAVDDVKIPALDDPNVFKPQQDVIDPQRRLGRPAPFVLANPHHSMAWAQTQPNALHAAISQLETELTQLQQVIAEHERAEQAGNLTQTEHEALKQYREDFDAILAEYEQLASTK